MATHAYITQRRVLATTAYLLAFLYGLYAAFEQRPHVDLLFAVTFAFVMAYLCIVDARLRSTPLAHSYHWLIFFTWPLAVPVYLAWSRKWKRMHWVAIMIGAFLGAIMLGGTVGVLLVDGV